VSDGYNDYLAGRFGPLPDDGAQLRAGLKHALEIIGSYELDCRSIDTYVTPENMGRGFCQGDVYQEAVKDVFYWMAQEAPKPIDAIARMRDLGFPDYDYLP
jgi:hypothetical protein